MKKIAHRPHKKSTEKWMGVSCRCISVVHDAKMNTGQWERSCGGVVREGVGLPYLSRMVQRLYLSNPY